MDPKRQEPTLTIRLPADIAERLRKFVETQEDWSKTEVVAVALNDFLAASDKARITSLVRYRTRKSAPLKPPGAVAPEKEEGGRRAARRK